MSKEEQLKIELLKKDKNILVELYLQKCFDTDVEIAELKQRIEMLQNGIVDDQSLKTLVEESPMYKELKAENERLKDENIKLCSGKTFYDYLKELQVSNRQQEQQLKDNTRQVCEKIRKIQHHISILMEQLIL